MANKVREEVQVASAAAEVAELIEYRRSKRWTNQELYQAYMLGKIEAAEF